MRWAAIDCGTNTVLLTIAERDAQGRLVPVDERAEITRLGEGLAQTGVLKEEAIARTAQVIEGYAKAIKLSGAEVRAVGTEALRRAKNGELARARFDAALGSVGATLEIIDGDREAALSFSAVRGSFPQLVGLRTVLDIGGGSTELVVGEDHVTEARSVPIGSVVLTEALLKTDPPTIEERHALVEAIDAALDRAPAPRGTIVGIAGTVTTFAAMSLGMDDYDATRVHGLRLRLDELDRQLERLGTMSVDDRRRTPGLQPKRADVIYAGGVILSRVLHRGGAADCLVSDRGVRWGLLYEAAGGAMNAP